MSGKINVFCIVSAHFNSLKNLNGKSLSSLDLVTFVFLPLFLALCGAFFSFNLNKDLDSLLVNFGSIFTALLLSVIVLIYDQENRLLEKINKNPEEVGKVTCIKLKLLKELYHNISFSVLCSLMLVVMAFIHTIMPIEPSFLRVIIPFTSIELKLSWSTTLVTPMIVLITSNIVLTIIMVVKRLYLILITNNPGS